MNNKLVGVIAFAAGVVLGGFLVKRSMEKKYILREVHEEEIQSVKEAFRTNAKPSNAEDLIDIYKTHSMDELSEARAQKRKPIDISPGLEERKEDTRVDKPYLISPEEFGEFDDYDTIDLKYYSNRVLTDDQDEIVDDIDAVVGRESLNHFGDYEDDAVFVRNDRLKCDYEILRELGAYTGSKRSRRMEE